jgi:hypothetical protein
LIRFPKGENPMDGDPIRIDDSLQFANQKRISVPNGSPIPSADVAHHVLAEHQVVISLFLGPVING